jgi:hypothetical protein
MSKKLITTAWEEFLYSHRNKPSRSLDRRMWCVRLLLERGFSPLDLIAALERNKCRLHLKLSGRPYWNSVNRREYYSILRECVFKPFATSSRFNCTGVDWVAFHRPSSNGIGWVLIAPDEPANNWYTDDPILVSFLRSKFNLS